MGMGFVACLERRRKCDNACCPYAAGVKVKMANKNHSRPYDGSDHPVVHGDLNKSTSSTSFTGFVEGGAPATLQGGKNNGPPFQVNNFNYFSFPMYPDCQWDAEETTEVSKEFSPPYPLE